MFSYSGYGLLVRKTEVMTLLDKTNIDWWKVRKSNGVVGYMPANRVKEIEPKFLNVEKEMPVTVIEERGGEDMGLPRPSNVPTHLVPHEVQLMHGVGNHEKGNLCSAVKDELDSQLQPHNIPTDSTNTPKFRPPVATPRASPKVVIF